MNKSRFDIYMSPELTEQFNGISDDSGYTRAEVFRRSIALYKVAKENQLNGGKLILKNLNNSEYELVGY